MKICLITGSTLGGAEYVAENLETVLQQKGFETEIHHGPNLDDVAAEKCWLVVTSTHGAGELPDNLSPLFNQIKQQSPDFSDVKFAVVGLGNSDYDTFCYAVDIVERNLTKLQAKQLCPSLKIDVLNTDDFDEVAENWLEQAFLASVE